MKYGITDRLREERVLLAQRFHINMLRRMYALQQGATPQADNLLDAAIAAVEAWAEGRKP